MPTETITADTDWVVPDGVFSVTVTLEGERGGSDDYTGTDYGGPGGRVVGELEVRPGEVLYIRETPGGTGAADGGDAIDVRTNGTSLEDRIAIAAGGGAGGEGSQIGTAFGGAGGPATGADGENGSSGGTPPTGGTQSSGGAGSGDGSNGSFGAGGDAGTNDSNAGHGGGAGLFGGGGGESTGVFGGVGDSGAGGSNYVDGLDTVIANERGASGRDHTDGGLVTIEYEPVAPENLTRSETTATSTTVTWDPPTLPPEVDSLDLYRVYRDLDAGSVRTDYAEVATRDPGQTTYDDVGLLNGRTYHYRIGADLTAPELDERDKPTAIPDSEVSRPADDSTAGFSSNAFGVRFETTEEWPEIGAEISQNTDSGVQNAQIIRESDFQVLEEIDISSLGPGDTFAFQNLQENIQPNANYLCVIQDPDSAQHGYYDNPSFPYTSSDGVISITNGGYVDGSSFDTSQDRAYSIVRIGNVGLA